MNVQKTRRKIGLARAADLERNRVAIARLKGRMMLSGETRLERQIDEIVTLATGVRP